MWSICMLCCYQRRECTLSKNVHIYRYLHTLFERQISIFCRLVALYSNIKMYFLLLESRYLSIDRYKIRYKFKTLAVKAVKCFIITMIKLHFWDIGGNGWHTVFKSNPTDVSDVWLLKLIFSAAKIKQLIN